MMADDSDDDKPLLFQFKNSKGSVRAKPSARHGASSSLPKSQAKPSKVFEAGDDDKSQNSTVNASQECGLLHDKSPSPHEPLANGMAARVITHKPGQVKVYTKRKKHPDGEDVAEDVGAKKLKSSSSFAVAAHSDENDRVDVDGSGFRESGGTVGAVANGIDQESYCGVRDHDDVNGDTHIQLGPKKKMLTNHGGMPIDDPRLSCGVGHTNSLSSKAAARMGLAKAEEEDDHLPLSRLSHPKKNKESGMKDGSHLAKNIAVKQDGCDILVNEEEEDDHLPLSKMSRPKKNKESVMDGKKLSAKNAVKEEGCSILVKEEGEEEEEDDRVPLSKMSCLKKKKESAMDDKKVSAKTAVKEEGFDTALSKDRDIKEKKQLDAKSVRVSKVSGIISENKVGTSSRDCIENEQLNCLSKEEEGDDDLPLSQMARPKKRKAPFGSRVPVGKDAGKVEGECRKRNDDILRQRKVSEERVTDISGQTSEEEIENTIRNGDDVSLCSPLCRKLENITDVMQEVSCKDKDATSGLVGKSRAKQLLALSKSLRDIDSEEEEEQEEKDDDSEDEVDDDEQEEDDEDSDEDEDYIRSKAKVAESPAVKSRSRTKVPSTTLKARASNQSKTRTPMSPSKSVKEIAVDEESEEEEEDEEEDEEEEEDYYSEEEDQEEEEDDDEEYSVLRGIKRKKTVTVRGTETSTGSKKKKAKKIVKEKQATKRVKKIKDIPGAGGGQKWTTLEHNGVIFPPFYQPHGIKMLYEGKPVDLTPEQEEVATMFAVMKETDYVSKPKFLANFWNDWKKLLGPNHVIQKLEDCDFTPIYEWHLAEKEKKKQLSSQEKKAMKEDKLKQEEKYMWAVVDGVKEKVGNFRVEPPGLFRGRGEHPKMGKLKRRIYPEDIVINIGANSPVPECPLSGHSWKEVRHDDTVTWLAYWNDPINTKEQKYVFLAASSTLKGQSDKEKYEKSRVLKDYIEDIRKTYTEKFTSSDPTARQIAVATYLIDRLALRAGNEKDDDEADTVGCCSLKVEHVSLVPPSSLQFDFLGKDSIRYFNVVKVVKPVYDAVGDFRKDKAVGSDLFDRLDTNKLNAHLKNIMPQLTAKVFRTYNASITLDTLLLDTDGHLLAEKIASYQRANKEVAILCNHQRSVSKSHGAQMERLEAKLAELSDLVDELEKDLERVRKGKPPLKDADGNPKKHQNPDVLERKIAQTKQKMERMKLDMTIKEDLKTVALGTSKINYLDPRITVAWCKKHEVPIEKIFNKSLLAKFAWAMDVDMNFRF